MSDFMLDDDHEGRAERPNEASASVGELCSLFSMNCRKRPSYRVEEHLACEFLKRFPATVAAGLLRNLCEVELEFRRAYGERPGPDEFRRRFPEWSSLFDELFAIASQVGVPDQDRAAAPDSTSGASLRFRDLRPMARGGLGEVYFAHDAELGREVALKEIQDHLADDDVARARFLLEAKITGGLEHPGVVAVYSLARHPDNRPYYAMRLIRGGSLKDAIERHHNRYGPAAQAAGGTPTLRQLLDRFIAVCNTIAYAHSRGVLHRDIKPSNIMTGAYGETIVVDWGLAKFIGGCAGSDEATSSFAAMSCEGGLSSPGSIVGTPGFVSPEQAAGETDLVGPASDVYSLGATLYNILTGRPPIQERVLAVAIAKTRRRDFAPPRQLEPSVPRGLEAICLKSLAFAPGDRYPNALALADDIQRWLGDESIVAMPDTPLQRLTRWGRRHRAWTRAGALMLVVVATVSIAAAGLVNEARKAEEERRKEADRLRSEATLRLARSELDQGLTLSARGDEHLGLLWLARGLKDAPRDAADLRHVILENIASWGGRFHAPLGGLEFQEAVNLSPAPHPVDLPPNHRDQGWVTCMNVSPDGTRLITGTGNGTAQIWDLKSARLACSTSVHQAPVNAVQFSPDGRMFVTGSEEGTAQIWDSATTQPVGPPLQHRGPVHAVAFSPGGASVVTAGEDRTAQFWDVVTGAPVGVALSHQDIVWAVAFSPDGRTVVTACGDGSAKLWDASSGLRTGPEFQHRAAVWTVAFSPDGKALLTGSEDRTARIWSISTGDPIGPPLQHQGWVRAACFSPDGKVVLTGSEDRSAQVWRADTGERVGAPIQHHEAVRSACFSVEGRRIFTGGYNNEVRQWDASTLCRTEDRFVSHSKAVRAVAFSPDGKRILTASFDSSARLWDAISGKSIGRPLSHAGGIWAAAFNPVDGTIVTGGQDNLARIWEARSHEPTSKSLQHSSWVWSVQFSPDGKTVATGGYDSTARLWDVATGASVGSPLPHQGTVWAVAFSPDGKTLLTASEDRTARLWDVVTGRPIGTPLRHRGAVRAVAFSPDGKTLLTASEDRTAQLWDSATSRPIGAPLLHQAEVVAATFSPNGRTVLTGSLDRTARLWDSATATAVGAPYRHPGWVWSVACSPDGKRFMTGSEDGIVRMWDMPEAPDDDPDRLVVWSQILSNCEIDESSTLRPFDGARWQAGLRELEAMGGAPIDIAALTEETFAWHTRQAASSERENRWEAARMHLDRMIEADASDYRIYLRRAQALERLGLTDQAIGDYAAAVRLGADKEDPKLVERLAFASASRGKWSEADELYKKAIDRGTDQYHLFAYGILKLQLRDADGFRDVCRRMLIGYGRSEDLNSIYAIVGLYAMGPDAAEDPSQFIVLAEKLASRARNRVHLEILGACYGRVGRHEEALKILDEAATVSEDERKEGSFLNWVFRSMSLRHLGRREEAEKWLGRSREWVDREIPDDPQAPSPSGLTWYQRVEFRSLYREAAQVGKSTLDK